jgi:hypothetical protein
MSCFSAVAWIQRPLRESDPRIKGIAQVSVNNQGGGELIDQNDEPSNWSRKLGGGGGRSLSETLIQTGRFDSILVADDLYHYWLLHQAKQRTEYTGRCRGHHFLSNLFTLRVSQRALSLALSKPRFLFPSSCARPAGWRGGNMVVYWWK